MKEGDAGQNGVTTSILPVNARRVYNTLMTTAGATRKQKAAKVAAMHRHRCCKLALQLAVREGGLHKHIIFGAALLAAGLMQPSFPAACAAGAAVQPSTPTPAADNTERQNLNIAS